MRFVQGSKGTIYRYLSIDRYMFQNFNINTESVTFNIISSTHQEEFFKQCCSLSIPYSLITNILT